MKSRHLKYLLAILLLAAVVLATVCFTLVPRYRSILKDNWGVELPVFARLRQIYSCSNSGFHGDGLRFHSFSYQYEDYIELMFAWGSFNRSTLFHSSIYEAAEAWMDELAVPLEQRPNFQSGALSHWYKVNDDSSELIILWNSEENMLYVLESFL